MNLENRGNGAWRLTISDGYNPDGTKVRFRQTIHVDPTRTVNAQRREAEKQAAILEADFRRRLLVAGNKLPLSELFEEYMRDSVQRRGLKPSTQKQYRDSFEGRILPALGKIPVQDLTRKDISAFYRSLEEAPSMSKRSRTGKLSGTYRHQYHVCLHAALAYAVKAGYISVNPADQVEPPRKDTRETKWYEPQDVARLFNAIDEECDLQWKLYFYLALYASTRPGELIALNWSDIKGNVMHIRASAYTVKGEGTKRADSPKTAKSNRQIALPPAVMTILEAHRRAQLEYRLPFGRHWPEPDAVFTTDDGKRMNKDSGTHKFQKLIKKYDLPPLTLYGLRHTGASALIAQGVSVRDVAARLGHAQTSTTLNVYAHAFEDANARATAAITAAYEQARAQA